MLIFPPSRKMKTFFICCVFLAFILLIICVHNGSAANACKVANEMADCSHLKLSQIPSDLPTNITALDISHNQLKQLPPVNLTKYSQLMYLDAGFNTISKLQSDLCQKLPLLKVLKLPRNQLYLLPDNVFNYCTDLTELNLGFNKIEVKNDPFKNLKVRCSFHLSMSRLWRIKGWIQLCRTRVLEA